MAAAPLLPVITSCRNACGAVGWWGMKRVRSVQGGESSGGRRLLPSHLYWVLALPAALLVAVEMVRRDATGFHWNWSFLGQKAGLLAVAAVFAAAAVWLQSDDRRKRRKERGQCHHCGYSLTGNVSGVCPECGTRLAR